MTFRTKIYFTRQIFFEKIELFIQLLAKNFGFPENPGMQIIPNAEYFWNKPRFSDDFPIHPPGFPVQQQPSNLFETIFGDMPKINAIPRIFYESESDGFYSFYIPNYKNIIFIPNILSEYLQVKCHFCLDLTSLEVAREVLFVVFLAYLHIIGIRFYMTWMISINPYTWPWVGITALVDWTEDLLMGVVPPIFGLNPGGILLSITIGKIVDSISQIVFTMPFLPSEGEPIKVLLGGEITPVLRFRYLPVLWYKYPIPNEVREFWYTQRPDIFIYMQKAYQNLPIEFTPDQLINKELISLKSFHNFINYDSIQILFANLFFSKDIL